MYYIHDGYLTMYIIPLLTLDIYSTDQKFYSSFQILFTIHMLQSLLIFYNFPAETEGKGSRCHNSDKCITTILKKSIFLILKLFSLKICYANNYWKNNFRFKLLLLNIWEF